MIIRILGEGQFDVPDDELGEVQAYDERLEAAVAAGDAEGTRVALTTLRERLLKAGTAVADDYLGASDIVVPYPDAGVDEVRELLNDDGLIPGT
ncbi:PspA-associated protein PspAA [Spelaeicoccus albus]|uniref:PspA-associated domain-containing protein n=1 Tax=Spelaeicoccus albus TaxID=1280376 RepID=A0A7Z0A9P3_9MICO|nr:hypothetical protein [Spelaeicoccus albus]NYI65930.1 hypothetical protein [Spelaeicoccus albus]